MKIMVSGLVNIETACPVKGFPLDYFPIDYPFNRISSGISGVGYNIIRNLKTLGDEVTFVSMTGRDLWSEVISGQLKNQGFSTDYLYPVLSAAPQSVILYDGSGKREIYCDLKDYQDVGIDMTQLEKQIEEADLIIACNSNFNRPLCALARQKGKLIATDVHVLSNAEDDYNKDFLQAADIVFLSDEGVSSTPEQLIREIYKLYHNTIIVMGCGSKGAVLYEAEYDRFTTVPAVTTRQVVSTSGAGDALFSTFLHFYVKRCSALDSLQRAVYAASYKIGEKISSEGFLSEEELEKLINETGGLI